MSSTPIRALTRRPGSAGLPDGTAAAHGSLTDIDSVREALTGTHTLFLVSRIGDDIAIIDAARDAGVEHVVLVSSITVETHPHLGPARDNASVERHLESSGLAWTILRPTQFASNSLLWAPEIRSTGRVQIPFPDARLPTIDPADIAAVAHAAITDARHRGRCLALTGPDPISAREQIAVLAAALGRDIAVAELSREQARRLLAPVFGERDVDAVLDVSGGALNGRIRQPRNTVHEVTCHPARTFHHWAESNASRFL